MAANSLPSSAVVVTSNNGSVPAPTAYTIVSGDVTNGLALLPATVTGALPYGQSGFVAERVTFVVNTTTAGTGFSVVVEPTASAADGLNDPPAFPSANAGPMTVNVNTVGTYLIGPLTSGRFQQQDGSILLTFTGTLGATTIYAIVEPYAPAGPRG